MTLPERVLQVVASGKRNGAEEALNGRNRVQEQRLGEVLRREYALQRFSPELNAASATIMTWSAILSMLMWES